MISQVVPMIRRSIRMITAYSLLFSSLAADAAEPKEKIEGTWYIVSVEIAGQKVDGLAGAELNLNQGKKTFKLPSGTVEKGTYTLDVKADPQQIDSTTEGRDGTEKGIYVVEKGTLKMCLAKAGGDRPQAFATDSGNGNVLLVLKSAPAKDVPALVVANNPPTGTRAFRMGFTGFVYDTTLEAVTSSRKFCRENGDVLAHHIEGVPWTEAFSGDPFPKALLEEWANKKLATPPKGKVYLAISPGRGDLKLADKGGPLPKELVGKAYDDPQVMQAYLNYCRRAIEFFKPDYLAIGIEVNEIHRDGGQKKWQAYSALHQHVYKELKKDHPDLPIFASWTLHQMFQVRGRMLADFQQMMPYNDVVAVSYYPFFVGEKDRLTALDWMLEKFDPFEKPYAMVETNDSAERLPLPQAKVTLDGNPTKQATYYRQLLSTAQKRNFLFVISFVHQDYDALWEKIKATAPELFKAWRDCGLLDEKGEARPAYQVWKSYFDLPFKK